MGEVAEHVAQTTGQARTTVLTIMERLRRKGYLTPKRMRRRLPLFPEDTQVRFSSRLGEEFVDTTLGGSVSPFVAFLSEGGPISESDLDSLKRFVREMENHVTENDDHDLDRPFRFMDDGDVAS